MCWGSMEDKMSPILSALLSIADDCIIKKIFREKFSFPFVMSEQSTAGRMETRLVKMALIICF